MITALPSHVASVAPAFRAICEKFRVLEGQKATEEATASFEQAQLIRDARVRLRVPVAAICDALGLSPQSVNTYRSVAERISEPRFRQLIGERRDDFLPLFPWSIIAQIARLDGQDEREELIEEIRRCAWRTRDVERLVSRRRRSTTTRRSGTKGGLASGRADEFESQSHEGMRGSRSAEGEDDVVSRVNELGNRMIILVNSGARDVARPAVLTEVTDVLTRVLVAAASAAASASRRAPPPELRRMLDVLIRCAAGIADARDVLSRRLGETEAPESRSGGVIGGHYPCVAAPEAPAVVHSPGHA